MRILVTMVSFALAALLTSPMLVAKAGTLPTRPASLDTATPAKPIPVINRSAARRVNPCRPRYKRVCSTKYKTKCFQPQHRNCVAKCMARPVGVQLQCRRKCKAMFCRKLSTGTSCRNVRVGTICDHIRQRDQQGPVRPRPPGPK